MHNEKCNTQKKIERNTDKRKTAHVHGSMRWSDQEFLKEKESMATKYFKRCPIT